MKSAKEMFEELGYKCTEEIIFPKDEDFRQWAIGYTKKDYTTLDVVSIYEQYGIDIMKIKELKFEK